MKTKTIICLSFIMFHLAATAQYHKISVEGRQWNEYSLGWLGGNMTFLTIRGDSIYEGETLPRLIEVDSSGNFLETVALIREDTIKPAITFLMMESQGQWLYGDSLYLDLSLNVGDSSTYQCVPGSDTVLNYYALDSTGHFIDQQGVSRKRYYYHTSGGSWSSGFNWVEGLGSIPSGGVVFFPPITCITDIPHHELLCVSDTDGTLLYKNQSRNTCVMEIGLSSTETNKLEIYPNPATEYINISTDIQPELLEIYDMNGKKLLHIPYPANQINLDALAPGLYHLHLRDQHGNLSKHQLIWGVE